VLPLTFIVLESIGHQPRATDVLRLHSRKPTSRHPVYRVTNSLQKRLSEHRSGQGSSFVKTCGVYRLVYVESYERPDEAIAREKQLKRWKRDWKIELIERENLEGRDLSDLLV
jgi:putative endonuclease